MATPRRCPHLAPRTKIRASQLLSLWVQHFTIIFFECFSFCLLFYGHNGFVYMYFSSAKCWAWSVCNPCSQKPKHIFILSVHTCSRARRSGAETEGWESTQGVSLSELKDTLKNPIFLFELLHSVLFCFSPTFTSFTGQNRCSYKRAFGSESWV